MVYVGDAKRDYQLEWITQRRQEWLRENGPCKSCGTWDNLEVDHIDPKTKALNPGRLWSLAKDNPIRVVELAKCQVLCFACHKDKTAKDNEYYKYIHGTYTSYNTGRCRCDPCKQANRDYMRKYRRN